MIIYFSNLTIDISHVKTFKVLLIILFFRFDQVDHNFSYRNSYNLHLAWLMFDRVDLKVKFLVLVALISSVIDVYHWDIDMVQS